MSTKLFPGLAFSAILLIGSSLMQPVQAQARYKFYDYGNGLGVNGYDTVAYFTRKKAVKGKDRHQTEFGGRTWQFANEKHLQQFEANPDKYLPVFGGHCAYGTSRGYLVRGDPEAWTVYRGKLYLNYSKAVRNTWKRNIDRNIAKANGHWPNLLNK